MKAKNTKIQNKSNQAPANANQTVEVLYQKLGDRWYAFSCIDDEVFVGSIDPEELEAKQAQKQKTYKISGNS